MTVIFTINGWNGDMWLGPQADVGRYLSDVGLNLCYWQPVGYEAGRFPLGGAVQSGVDEMHRLLDEVHPTGPFLTSSWSLGAIVQVLLLQEMRAGGRNAHRLPDWKGATTFGNPYREAHKWAPRTGVGAVPDPGRAGIGGPRNNLVDTPDWWHDYAHPGDLYTCCDEGSTGDDQRIIFNLVLERWGGLVLDLWAEAMELVSKQLAAAPAILWAIIESLIFFGGGTREHINYSAITTGANNFSAGIARGLL